MEQYKGHINKENVNLNLILLTSIAYLKTNIAD